jgi:hypothetical protein
VTRIRDTVPETLDRKHWAGSTGPGSAPGEALLEQRSLGWVGGQLGRTAVRGAGLVGVAELTQEFGAGRVIQIVIHERAGQVVQFGRGARRVAERVSR